MLFGTPVCVLLCCTFAIVGCTTTPQFYYGFLFPALYSEHKIFLFFSFDIFFPIIIFSLLYLAHSTLLPPPFLLHFHASKHLPHHKFLSCFPKINPYPHFSSVLVPLYLHPSHSTNVTIFLFVLLPFFSNAVPFSTGSMLVFSPAVPFVALSYVLLLPLYTALLSYSTPQTYFGEQLSPFLLFLYSCNFGPDA